MKIINIKDYKIPAIDENNKEVEIPYRVGTSIASIVLSRHNQWDGLELLEASKIADKIKSAKNQIILENAEYEIVKKAVNGFKGYNGQEVEMVKRVTEAKDYKLAKTKK